ncbi:cupredoxin domain-containing protein [Halostagnicola bangensis]
MNRATSLSRRRTILLFGGIATVTSLAGCGGLGEDDTEEDDDESPLVDDEEPAGDASDWEDVSEIMLEAEESGWTGVEPELIDGDENPALMLTAGESYEITWENVDGNQHNIALRTDAMEIVEEYQTELVSGTGETQTLEFEATTEMDLYVCEAHTEGMTGFVEIVDGEAE